MVNQVKVQWNFAQEHITQFRVSRHYNEGQLSPEIREGFPCGTLFYMLPLQTDPNSWLLLLSLISVVLVNQKQLEALPGKPLYFM